jgi:hypothetical protein
VLLSVVFVNVVFLNVVAERQATSYDFGITVEMARS